MAGQWSGMFTAAIAVASSTGTNRAAEESRAALAATGRYMKPILTPIREAGEFHVAEEYHQDYYEKNPVRYNLYRYGSGRDQYLDKTWGEEIHVDYGEYSPGKG